MASLLMARTRPGIRVHLSIADHDKTSAVWANLEQRGMLVELWRKAGEKFAGKRGDQVPLKPTDRMDIACTTDAQTADRMLRELCVTLRYSVKTYPNRWVVTIRNFAKKQGYQPQEPDAVPGSICTNNSTPPIPSPSPIPIPSPRERERRPREPRTGCPESLPEPHQANAIEWASTKDVGKTELAFRWERVRRWSEQNPSKLRTAKGWYATLRNAIDDRWGGDPDSNAPPDESPAQGRQRRTREAAADALAILKNREAERKLELVAGVYT